MSKFNGGDRARCITPDNYGDTFMVPGDVVTVSHSGCASCIFRDISGNLWWDDNFELGAEESAAPASPEPPAGLLDFVRENLMSGANDGPNGWTAGYCAALTDVLRRFYGLKSDHVPATVTFEAV